MGGWSAIRKLPETGLWEVPKSFAGGGQKSNRYGSDARLLIASHSPNALLKPDCTYALRRKAKVVTACAAERAILCGPVCQGIIAKYGHVSRISG
jgi:hypothetical protein